jgi:RNA polymerase sigma-70 factor (ECF subfamily)
MEASRAALGREAVERLVTSAKAQDSAALAELCVHFYPKVYRYVLPRVASPEDAEDLASEVCVRVVESLPRQRGLFAAWVFRIAGNIVTDYHRRRRVRQEEVLSDTHAATIAGPDGKVEEALVRDELEAAISKLTTEQQEVVRLRFLEGFDVMDIAAIQNRSVGAVRALQFRALNALRDYLTADDGV